jgi:hypothetical protein
MVPIVNIPSNLPWEQLGSVVRRSLENSKAVIVRNVFSKNEILSALESFRENFDQNKDSATIGESPDRVMSNFQKLNVGGLFNTKIYRPRFLRAVYNPIWEPDIYLLRGLFQKFAEFRNHVLGNEPKFAINSISEDGSWTASRLQHYPVGGGFLVKHVDSVLASVHDWAGYKQYLQFLLPLTKKGEDYSRGGGFVYVGGDKVVIDDHMERGDIAIYSGLIEHGVDEIDPHHPLDLGVRRGRIVAFVSLYKDFREASKIEVRYREIEN